MSRIGVRKAQLADVPAVAAMARELNRLHRDPTRHFTAAAFRHHGFGRKRRFELLIARLDRRPAGYALFVPAYETAWAAPGLYLQNLFVCAEARRRGVGRALVAAVCAECIGRGAAYVWTAARTWNRDAQAFYRATADEEELVVAFAWHGANLRRLAGRSVGARGARPASMQDSAHEILSLARRAALNGSCR